MNVKKEIVPLMGTIVRVYAVAQIRYRDLKPGEKDDRVVLAISYREVHAIPLTVHRNGWVVGITSWQEGFVHPPTGLGSLPTGDPYEYEPGFLSKIVTVPLLLVSFWPSMKAVRVPFNRPRQNGTECWHPDISRQPISPSQYSWLTTPAHTKQRVRQEIRNQVANAPRDKKGRFVKE